MWEVTERRSNEVKMEEDLVESSEEKREFVAVMFPPCRARRGELRERGRS